MTLQCSVDGCTRAPRAKGLCNLHYQRHRKGADLFASIQIRRGGLFKHGSLEERFWSKVALAVDNECWEWTAHKNPNGYGQISIGTRQESRWLAPRVSWLLHYHSDPGELDVCHTCDNPGCVNPNHLFLGDAQANANDSINKGRHSPPPRLLGSSHPNAKLNEEAVREIRSSPLSAAEMAVKFGVTKTAVDYVRKRRTWRHL
jgi:hypothetical protein